MNNIKMDGILTKTFCIVFQVLKLLLTKDTAIKACKIQSSVL